jgi:hypothetical protein
MRSQQWANNRPDNRVELFAPSLQKNSCKEMLEQPSKMEDVK